MEPIRAVLHVDLFQDPLDVDWPQEGDELLHHMWDALRDTVGLNGYAYQQHQPTEAEPYFYFGYRPNSPALHSELALVPTKEGIRAFVGVENAADVPDQVAPWADALIEATHRLNRPRPSHAWRAVIGPAGRQLRGAQRLTQESEVGGMRLAKATTLYYDASTTGSVPSLNGYGVDVSYPVFVAGEDVGYAWPIASETAARRLNQLCALLSLALDANWRVRQAAALTDMSAEVLPRSRFGPSVFPEGDDNYMTQDVTVPEWVATSWQFLEADDALRHSLHAHHQGLAMEDEFPSHALIAYVGSIEGIGGRTVPLRPCDCCEGCPVTIGAGRRFRTALKQVLPPEDAAFLNEHYESRSKTAHEGQLHGDELTAGGWPSPQVFAPRPPGETFRYQVVWRMRRASRAVLLNALGVAPEDGR